MDRVIFRKWPNGDIIALLPDNVANPGMVDMYEHVGQHGEGMPGIVSSTSLATPEEYADLLKELKQIGYEPRIMQRLPSRQ
ncbi:hypothetical protein LCGC14_1929600 [marine sediment metagenome]|uniref:Uncharacterized protein n=1 Tax=marine sediment metagenome TaxID=412755 RepID=A0A0F9IL58_9ZZZZ